MALRIGDYHRDCVSGTVRVCFETGDGCRLSRWMTTHQMAEYMLKLREFVQDEPCCCFDEYGKKHPFTCDRCRVLSGLTENA